jgi:hypothetical protein
VSATAAPGTARQGSRAALGGCRGLSRPLGHWRAAGARWSRRVSPCRLMFPGYSGPGQALGIRHQQGGRGCECRQAFPRQARPSFRVGHKGCRRLVVP